MMLDNLIQAISKLKLKTTKVVVSENVLIDSEVLKSELNTSSIADIIELKVEKITNSNIGLENEKLYDIVQSYNIELLRNKLNITQLLNPLKITIKLDRLQDKVLKVIRKHEEVFTILDDLDDDDYTITFETDKFSEYTVVVEENKVTTSVGENKLIEDNNSLMKKVEDTQSIGSVKTNVDTSSANILIYVGLMTLAFTVLLRLRKNK